MELDRYVELKAKGAVQLKSDGAGAYEIVEQVYDAATGEALAPALHPFNNAGLAGDIATLEADIAEKQLALAALQALATDVVILDATPLEQPAPPPEEPPL